MNTADIRKIFRAHARPGEFMNALQNPMEGAVTLVASSAQGEVRVIISEADLVLAVNPELVIQAKVVQCLKQLRGETDEKS